ncbi:MAG: hypothetical protein IPH10_12670 [bacterium]|nr:hypothetical protein [bacterium]
MNKTLIWTALLCTALLTTAASARHSDDLDRIRIEGRIESIRGQIAYIEDDCGETFRVHLGPQWYWDDRDYYLRSGWYVTVIAWQDPYEDYCYAGEIRGRDFCYDLCDSRGYPRWRNDDGCYSGWRPTRSFFEIYFVIGDPLWHCSHHRHYSLCSDACWHDGPRHRRWYSHDDRDHDRHGRDGRRDHGGGGRFSDNDDRGGSGSGEDVKIVKPRSSDRIPGGESKGGSNYKIEKPRKIEKSHVSTRSSSSRANTKSERKVQVKSEKSYARK